MKFFACYCNYNSKKRQRIHSWLTALDPAIKRKIIMRINFTVFVLLFTILNVWASGYAQRISISFNKVPIATVLGEITKQTGYKAWYNDNLIRQTHPVNVDIKNGSLTEALDACFESQPLTYKIVDKTIIIKAKATSIKDKVYSLIKRFTITGKVTDSKNQLLQGVEIRVAGTDSHTATNSKGEFSIDIPNEKGVLQFSHVGYQTLEIPVNEKGNLAIVLKETVGQLQEFSVVSNGYQTIPLERATGSFVKIDNELLNRRVSTNILERLDGITSGLTFNKNGLAQNESLGISIRGRSTLDPKVKADPLVIVDNFPYEGDLSNINPNDVESITVLKDAAAASIWGARSGNGVIVISTKKGKLNQTLQVGLNSNVTLGSKPDLFYSKNFLNVSDYIDAEKALFDKGYFDADIGNTTAQAVLSPAIEILSRQRAGTISAAAAEQQLSALHSYDIRKDLTQYLYRKTVNQQHAVNFNGGSSKVTYAFSAGMDKNLASLKRNGFDRLTLNSNNTFEPLKGLIITTGLTYVQSNTDNNASGLDYNGLQPGGRYSLYPYARLKDDNGNPAILNKSYNNDYKSRMMANGYLDWNYRPLEELRIADNSIRLFNLQARTGISYKFTSFLSSSVQYQYETQTTKRRNLQTQDSYSTRNTINQFAQRSATGIFTYPAPLGGILDIYQNDLSGHNFRTQFNYDQTLGQIHKLTAIAGAEVRQIKSEGYGQRSYGYKDDLGTSVSNIDYVTFFPTNPSGARPISAVDASIKGTTNRFISYYANAGYTFKDRYTFTASGRRDGANIFGVKTNDRITPLWSAGLGWEISREGFYHSEWLPFLKLRTTYGFNGNVYNGSAYLTAQYDISGRNLNSYANVVSPPNEYLTWERVRNTNVGFDFASIGNRISGTIEMYQKDGLDLIEDALLAPTSGFTSYKGNAASTQTKGVDFILNSINTKGAVRWTTNFLFSYLKDKVTAYNTKNNNAKLLIQAGSYGDPTEGGLFAVVGKPLYGIYSYRWAGLDPKNGDPQGYLDGKVSKDYLAILNAGTPDNVVFKGSSRPTVFGSLRNTIMWKDITFSANITYKMGFFFRRGVFSGNLQEVLTTAGENEEYTRRWQKPGDEQLTNVPSATYPVNTNRSAFYQAAEINVEPADHIRLQDISLGYQLSRKRCLTLPVSSLNIYLYINNMGILWRKNNVGIDPDYVSAYGIIYPSPRTISIGLRVGI